MKNTYLKQLGNRQLPYSRENHSLKLPSNLKEYNKCYSLWKPPKRVPRGLSKILLSPTAPPPLLLCGFQKFFYVCIESTQLIAKTLQPQNFLPLNPLPKANCFWHIREGAPAGILSSLATLNNFCHKREATPLHKNGITELNGTSIGSTEKAHHYASPFS